MKVGLAQIDCWVGDLEGNVGRCVAAVESAAAGGAELVLLPELAVTGYPPRDLLYDDSFVAAALEATADLADRLHDAPPTVVGSVARATDRPPGHPGLHNVAAVLEGGRVTAWVAKRLLPAYDVFHEPRWFLPGESRGPVDLAGHRLGLLVCEDLWDEGYAVHPPADLRAAGAELLVCLAALPFRRGAAGLRLSHARRAALPIAHVNAVGAQDEVVFDGRSFVLDGEGEVVTQLPAFREAVEVVEVPVAHGPEPMAADRLHDRRLFDLDLTRERGPEDLSVNSTERSFGPPPRQAPAKDTAVIPSPSSRTAGEESDDEIPGIRSLTRRPGSALRDDSPLPPATGDYRFKAQNDASGLDELHDALVAGIRGFVEKNRLGPAFLGLSGGIDSALVARLAVDALGADRVRVVAIPSRHTVRGSIEAAREIASSLGIGLDEVPLETLHSAAETTLAHLLDETTLGRLADENLQARLRMVVLMAHVNRHRGFLFNTSNKTEISLGYGTLYGDLAGALAPIADLTKLDVVDLARHLGGIPTFVLERPPTAELSAGQVDPFDYASESPRLESLVRSHRSDAVLRRSEHKRGQFGVVLKVSETAFGSGRLVPITRR